MTAIQLTAVTVANRRDCADLEVTAEQQALVSPVTRYPCLCHYGCAASTAAPRRP